LKSRNYDDEDTPPPRIVLPSMDIARTFAVKTIDYPHPLDVHQVHRHIENKYLSLDEWCPEYKLCSDDHILNDYGQASGSEGRTETIVRTGNGVGRIGREVEVREGLGWRR